MSAQWQDLVPTPNRKTVLEVDGTQFWCNRHPWELTRKATEIGRSDVKIGPVYTTSRLTSGVIRVPDAWIMHGFLGEAISVTKATFGGSFVTGVTPSNFPLIPIYRPPVDLPGNGISGWNGTPLSGYKKQVRRSQPWDGSANMLAADAVSFPAPILTDQLTPMDRVFGSSATFPENQGFMLHFRLPDDPFGSDAFARFYFGGPAPTDTVGTTSGQFCLSLHGSGSAYLYELGPPSGLGGTMQFTDWIFRDRIQWAEPGRVAAPLHHCIFIIPYGYDRMVFFSRSTGAELGNPVLDLLSILADPGFPKVNFYRNETGKTGFKKTRSMTGVGPVRLDWNRMQRTPFGVYRLMMPTSGILTDAPFALDAAPPAGTQLRVIPDTYTVLGGNIHTQLFDPASGVELSVDGSGTYLTNADQRFYFARFTFTPTADRWTTPVLWGVRFEVPGATNLRTVSPVIGGNVRRILMTGPNTTPDDEGVGVGVADVQATLATLATKAGQYARLKVIDPRDQSTRTVLMDGIIPRPRGRQKGRTKTTGESGGPTQQYPSANWRDYDLRIAGMAKKIRRKVVTSIVNKYARDPSDSATPPRPWKCTDVIRDMFTQAGADASELDIPDSNQRLFPTPDQSVDLYQINPGVYWMDLILHVARNYLGQIIVRDPNVGPRGMWRLLPNPTSPYNNILAEFHEGYPSGATPKIATVEGAWDADGTVAGAVQTWIEDETYEEYVDPPEHNHIIYKAPTGPKNELVTFELRNFKSYDAVPGSADANSIDYTNGEELPMQRIETRPITVEEARVRCRRIFDFTCHGLKWCVFRAPLVLVNDPTDALLGTKKRIPRINDEVKVRGAKAFVFTCDPDYESDYAQMAEYVCLFAPTDVFPGPVTGLAGEMERVRRAHASNAGRSFGIDGSYIRVWTDEVSDLMYTRTSVNLPMSYSNPYKPLQDPHTGQLIFIPGYDDPSDTTKLLA